MYEHTSFYLETYEILYKNQYGFRTKQSTIDAISKFIAEIGTCLNGKKR